jgi:DNA polymerase-3 subunit beta
MKLTVLKDQLLDKINLASRFTSNKLSTVTTLQGILLKGEKNKLHLYATDLTSFIHTTMQTEISEPFQVIIEPKKIVEFLQLLPTGKITFEVLEKQITITQDKTKGNFPLIVSQDFPLPPEIKDKPEKITTKFLQENIPLVLFTASSDDTRPVLTGINFIASDDELIIVSTDGFRLSLIKTKQTSDMPSMLIPSDFLSELLRYSKDEKEVQFAFSREEKTAMFSLTDTEFYTRLIEGEFPPYDRVIPAETKTTITIDREELLRSIKLISVFAREFSNVVVCEFKKDGLYIRPKKDSNEDNSAFVETEMKGEEQKVAFNFKFVIDLLNNVGSKTLHLEILRPDAPVVFKTDKNPNFLHIIMPVRIQE